LIEIGFISRNEFADIIKLILYGENGTGDVNDAYIEELTSAMDFDKNGKIDFNEFLGKLLLFLSILSDLFFSYRKFPNC
jgi:Ca2+-binding EF-hand superfamily protein